MRTSLAVQPHLYMADTSGKPLDYGQVYFGQPNKDPEFYPIDVFYDEALTVPAMQPVRTKGGFLKANGDMVEIYAAEIEYSVKVFDQYGRQVFYNPVMRRTNTDSSITIHLDYAGAIPRPLNEKNAEIISLKDFGGKGDGVSDDTTAVENFIDAMLVSGSLSSIPAGHYLVSRQIIIDMGKYQLSRNQGFRMIGDGLRRSILKSNYNSGPAFKIVNSDTTTGNGNAFYPEILGIGFENNAPYPCVQIGEQDFSDEINAVNFNFSANNANTTSQSCALEVNGVYQGTANITCNTGGTSTNGDALRLRQAQFLQFTGSGGNAANSIHFTGGYNYANVFLNWDAEEVKTCVVIDNPESASNTFVGGQFVWSVHAINATAGNNNYFLNTNFALSANIVAGDVGIAVIGQGKSFGTAYQPPTVFASNKNSDSLARLDAKSGYSAGLVWSIENNPRFRFDSDGNNLICRAWNNDLGRYLDAFYIDTAGVLNINQSKVNYFGLQTQAVGRQIVSGSKGGNAALSSLIAALAKFGLITDNTTA